MTGTAGLLLTSQALRGVGYGIAAVRLGAILRLDGLTQAEVGPTPAASLSGTLISSLALARWGDRAGRRRGHAALYAACSARGSRSRPGRPGGCRRWWP
ncbi:hypothetical protein HII36_39480 [Nonomuraea sp. NN258]|uniref:hypothetical protein n=1 Tax=Nonomuraea antri TaxID=2730852 RepID=UPI001569888F|nr:hypothetical protein [Nonomuraea antri]NRQ37870.1 hypothetical protein [Nonomuraea antri]